MEGDTHERKDEREPRKDRERKLQALRREAREERHDLLGSVSASRPVHKTRTTRTVIATSA
jgi:hypothetical protein